MTDTVILYDGNHRRMMRRGLHDWAEKKGLMGHLQETMKSVEAQEAAEQGSLADVAATIAAGESVDQPVGPIGPIWLIGDPDVGDMVVYQPRRGEIRRGRNRIAAIVTHRYPDARLLDLAIVFEASDVVDQQRVPAAVGEERGWIAKGAAISPVADMDAPPGGWVPMPGQNEAAMLRAEVAELRALVLGEFSVPDRSILDMLNDVDERVDAMRAHLVLPKEQPKAAVKAKHPAKKAKRGK